MDAATKTVRIDVDTHQLLRIYAAQHEMSLRDALAEAVNKLIRSEK